MNKQRTLTNFVFLIAIPLLVAIISKTPYGLIVFGCALLGKFIQIKKRKYFMIDKSGKKIGVKEFFSRWKNGIEGITPLQQAETNLMGNWIVIIGILSGMVINALIRMKDQWWWIEIILAGSLILVVIQVIGGLQKYWRFKEINKAQKELMKND